jgi:SWI/SNF related-matrix-associated actin-dependent regulator of chromatin subfamily C
LGNRFITTALIRRTLPGDAGSINRLHQFLMSYGLINSDAINDSTPTTFAMRDHKKRPRTSKFQDKLSEVVLKKHKENPTINWQSVADQLGDGATATDCQKGFLAINLEEARPSATTSLERSITPEPSEKVAQKPAAAGSLMIEEILANMDDKVLIPTMETALKHTAELGQARSAVVAALLASHATEKAKAEEEALGHVLAELNEKRMQRLEKRIELLNDVEGMMEAERMALELERRDLYTARCRHWFGGSS